jgi:hypothetical protein
MGITIEICREMESIFAARNERSSVRLQIRRDLSTDGVSNDDAKLSQWVFRGLQVYHRSVPEAPN